MSTYHFPIILGQNADERIVMIHLTNSTRAIFEENRVVACSGNQDLPLFKIPQDVVLIDKDGNTKKIKMGEDFKVYNESATGSRLELLPRKNDDVYEFRVDDNNIEKGIFDGTIAFEYNNGIDKKLCVDKLCIVRTDNVLNLNVDLGSEATQACCYSSQLLETGETDMVGVVNVLKDFYEKKGRKYDQLVGVTKQPLFTQEEADRPYFYKTGNITFYYDETGVSDETVVSIIGNLDTNDKDIEAWLDGSLGTRASTGDASDPAFINYLNVSAAGKNKNATKSTVWSDETKYTRKLINIKILYANMERLGGYVANIGFKDGTRNRTLSSRNSLLKVLRSIYKQIIVSSIKAIEPQIDAGLDECDVISVLILVPNIYNQTAIDHLLHDLNKLNKPNKNQQKKQLRFDFRVVSESDAAFLGIKEIQDGNNTILNTVTQGAKNERQKDLFLVIDSGKGTTDFSIIHYNPESTVNPVFSVQRDGIAGAGGAIDYVFARIVARQLYALSPITGKCPKETFVDRFMSLLTKMSPDYQDKLMRVVELTKINYDKNKDGDPSIPNVQSCFPPIVIETLLKPGEPNWSTITTDSSWQSMRGWMWNNNEIWKVEEEDINEIENVCRMIAETIIDKVFKKDENLARGIDYVIFTGRSFDFKPLRDAFENTLKDKRGFYEENMTVPYLEAGFYMLYRWFNKTILKKSSDELEQKHANLRVAPIDGYSMKEISVQFTDHNLGCNCNSDLCCLNGLQIRKDGEYRFDMKKFWEGFTDSNNNKVYYLGYPGKSFTGKGVKGGKGKHSQKTDDENKLIDMTLFPIQYIKVDLEPGGQQVGHNAESGDPLGNTNSVEDVDSFDK